MISVTPLIEHLRPKPQGFPFTWFKDVDGAGSYARLNANNLPLPAAWLVRAAEPKPGQAGEGLAQVTVAFDVVIAIENRQQHRRGELDDELLAYRLAVKNRLLGWRMPGQSEQDSPISYGGGQVLQYTDTDAFWRDRYQIATLVTNYLPDPSNEFDQLIPSGA